MSGLKVYDLRPGAKRRFTADVALHRRFKTIADATEAYLIEAEKYNKNRDNLQKSVEAKLSMGRWNTRQRALTSRNALYDYISCKKNFTFASLYCFAVTVGVRMDKLEELDAIWTAPNERGVGKQWKVEYKVAKLTPDMKRYEIETKTHYCNDIDAGMYLDNDFL